jgi:hypothetical protein
MRIPDSRPADPDQAAAARPELTGTELTGTDRYRP